MILITSVQQALQAKQPQTNNSYQLITFTAFLISQIKYSYQKQDSKLKIVIHITTNATHIIIQTNTRNKQHTLLVP